MEEYVARCSLCPCSPTGSRRSASAVSTTTSGWMPARQLWASRRAQRAAGRSCAVQHPRHTSPCRTAVCSRTPPSRRLGPRKRGSVGPNRPRKRVPVAAARCRTPLSGLMTRSAPARRAATLGSSGQLGLFQEDGARRLPHDVTGHSAPGSCQHEGPNTTAA